MTPAELKAERALGESYLRLRTKLAPWGSFDTAWGGTDRFEKTELALDALLAEYQRYRDAYYDLHGLLD